MKSLIRKSLFVVFMGILIFSCSSKDESMKLGVLLDQTGALAPYAQRALNGLNLAIEEINSKGGVSGRKVNLIIEDTKAQAQPGLSAFQKLINVDKVRIVIGPISSSVAAACLPIANDTKTVLFSPGATSPTLSVAKDYFLRTRLSGQYEVQAMADLMYSKLGFKEVTILWVNNEYGSGNLTAFKDSYIKLGGTIVSEDAIEQGQTDFRVQLTKLMSIKPKAVFIIAHAIETGRIARQSKELGFKSQLLSTLSVESPQFWEAAGDAGNGIIYSIQGFDANDSTSSTSKFVEKYKTRYGESPDLFAANFYDAPFILKKAIEHQKTMEPDSIIASIMELRGFEGVVGKIEFVDTGDVIAPVFLRETFNGSFKTLK